MISEATIHGGSHYIGSGGTHSAFRSASVYVCNASSITLKMMDATTLPLGYEVVVLNISGSSAAQVNTHADTAIGTLAIGTSYKLLLVNNSTSEGVWRKKTSTIGTPRTLSPASRSAISPVSTPSPNQECNYAAYQLVACDGTGTIYTNTDLSSYIDDEEIVIISGDDRCFRPEVADSILLPSAPVAVTVTGTFDNSEGLGCANCSTIYTLTNCSNDSDIIYTEDDFSEYIGQIVKVNSDSDKCRIVDREPKASQTLVSKTVLESYDDCECCLAALTNTCGLGTLSAAIVSFSSSIYIEPGYASPVQDTCLSCPTSVSATIPYVGVDGSGAWLYRGYTGSSCVNSTGTRIYIWAEVSYYMQTPNDPLYVELRFYGSRSSTSPLLAPSGNNYPTWGFSVSGGWNCGYEEVSGCVGTLVKECDEQPVCAYYTTALWYERRPPSRYTVTFIPCVRYQSTPVDEEGDPI